MNNIISKPIIFDDLFFKQFCNELLLHHSDIHPLRVQSADLRYDPKDYHTPRPFVFDCYHQGGEQPYTTNDRMHGCKYNMSVRDVVQILYDLLSSKQYASLDPVMVLYHPASDENQMR